MRVIGITGGAGSGKTELLSYIRDRYRCKVILADEVAHTVEEPGQPCYLELTELLGRDILSGDERIDRRKMAAKIFADGKLLQSVNRIIHPKVKEWILSAIEEARRENSPDFLFIEAALLIEEGYADIADELWYIYAEENVRRERLKRSRAYEDERIEGIFQSQLSEGEYRKWCRTVIDNSGSLQDTYKQIDEKLEEYL